MNNRDWNEIDAAAEREGSAQCRAFRPSSTPHTMLRNIFSTHRGHGAGAVNPPSGSKLHELPEAA
jgi:hypothetical protein